MAPRRKPTKAEQKARAARRAQKQQEGAAKPAAVAATTTPQRVDFDAIRARAGGKKLVLHVGCGIDHPDKLHQTYRNDNWHEVRLDINPAAKPDIISDMCNMSAVPDGAVDAVYSSHNLEHLFIHDTPAAMNEFYRVLAFGGHVLTTMPDIQTVANYVANGNLLEPLYDSPSGPIAPIDILYGLRKQLARGNHFMAHRCGFTASSLTELLKAAGFCNLRISREWVNLWGVGHKFAADDPRRSDKVETVLSKQTHEMKLPQPLPLNRTPHPGQFARNILSDELDLPPVKWEPLGLKPAA